MTKSVFRISENPQGVNLQGAQMGQKFIYSRIWGPRSLTSLQIWEMMKRFLDFYEISDFALINYIWNITIYKADEKKDIFVNAHSPIVLKWKLGI